MAGEYQIIIDGYHVKEIRCKNDNCRALIGYENVKLGVNIFICTKCDFISVFHWTYKNNSKKFIDILKQKFEVEKGGEKING